MRSPVLVNLPALLSKLRCQRFGYIDASEDFQEGSRIYAICWRERPSARITWFDWLVCLARPCATIRRQACQLGDRVVSDLFQIRLA